MFQFISSLSKASQVPLSALKIKMTEGDQSETYVSSEFLGKELKQRLEIFKPLSNGAPNVLDFSDVFLDSDKIKKGGEDCAPYRIMGTTLAGNHGWFIRRVTAVGHGKTQADVGSVWNDGSQDRIIYAIEDTDRLWMDNPTAVGLTMNHVSGATNTASFTITSEDNRQFYPVTKNHSMILKVDGEERLIATGEHEAYDDIVVEESYEILEKNSVRSWLQSNAGSVPALTEFDSDSWVKVTIKCRYTRFGNTLETDFLVLPAGDGMSFQDIMFVMGFELVPTVDYPNLKAYIPKTVPFSQDGNDFDFANIESADFLPLPSRVNITAGRSEPSGIFPDRHLYLLDGLGFSMGYLPIHDADPSVRRTRANNKAMQLSQSGKIYMSAIDDDGKSSLSAGDYYKVVAYKTFFESSTNRTAYYVVDADDGDYYLYADWHNLPFNDELSLPSQLWGKDIVEIEKSSNVSYSGSVAQSTLGVTISNTRTYGYLILKFTIIVPDSVDVTNVTDGN